LPEGISRPGQKARTNAGYVTSLERNESCLKVEQAPGVCEIQMVETHEFQQRNDELTEVKFSIFVNYKLIIITSYSKHACGDGLLRKPPMVAALQWQ